MVVQRDIVAISIPFSAGVASAAVLSPGGDALFWTAAGSCLAAAGLLFLACRREVRTPVFLALFWVLGVFCHCSSALAFPLPREAWQPAERALAGLLRAIDGAEFPHENTAALLKALLAGRREGLDRDTVAVFRAAGASHILALSGLHLGILYGMLHVLLRWMGRSRFAMAARSVIQVCLAAGYVVMTGASPSLVRAFLFILIHELSRHLPGRRMKPQNVFCAALTLQLAVSPAVVRSLGFQLSYLAMLGIITVFPRLEAWYPKGPRLDPVRRIWTATALTLSCQVFTAPLVWIRFHTFPKYFLLTNLAALPLTEGFLFSALPALAGIFPAGTKKLADLLGQSLLSLLGAIAATP